MAIFISESKKFEVNRAGGEEIVARVFPKNQFGREPLEK